MVGVLNIGPAAAGPAAPVPTALCCDLCVYTAYLATRITLSVATCGRSVSIATRVCPLQTQVDDHVVCHTPVALRLHGR